MRAIDSTHSSFANFRHDVIMPVPGRWMEVRMMTDVLVVGAGPTGLMLANQLGRRGVRTMIIDRHSGPAQQTRAMAVHARTLEIYAKMGLVERALELGRPGYGA